MRRRPIYNLHSNSSDFCSAAAALLLLLLLLLYFQSSIATWLRAKSKSHAPHCVCGGTSHLILLLHVGEHALTKLDICGNRCDTAAAIAATATWLRCCFVYVISVVISVAAAVVVVAAAAIYAAAVVGIIIIIIIGILNAHQSHKLGCHFAIRVLREMSIAPFVGRVFALLRAPKKLTLLLLLRISIGVDNARIIVFWQL